MILLQEIYKDNPWKMLVGCILLNQTWRKQVDTVRDDLFQRWPDAASMSEADPHEIATIIKPCGLQNRRAKFLVQFSRAWKDWPEGTDLMKYPGIGKYAVDSYRIFVEETTNIEVNDKELKKYLSSINGN